MRGVQGVRRDVSDALKQLHLTRKNHCVIIEDKGTLTGTLVLIRNYITWGEADDETLALLSKKGEAPYRLSPPRKGFGGSIKTAYPKGALGYRGDKIKELIKAMV